MASKNFHRSDSLIKLAERLQLYNPNNHPLNNTHIQNQSPRIQECTVNEVVSKEQELKSEFGTDPIANNSRRVKSDRASVLVCLFEDQKGHLRVILTKRASTLSTHSGNYLIAQFLFLFWLLNSVSPFYDTLSFLIC